MKTAFRALLVALWGVASVAFSAEENLRPYQPAGPIHRISVSSSASTAEQIAPTSSGWNGCTQYRMENTGSVDLYVGFGSSASEAQTNAADAPAAGDTGVAFLLRAGDREVVTHIPNVYVSAKTASSTSTLDIGCGVGHLVSAGGAVSGTVSTTPPTGTSATQVQGTAADGAAAVGSPVQAGGVDGSGNAQSLLTDTSGRQQVVGAAAAGSAPAGDPVLLGYFDGTNVQRVRGNTVAQFVQGPDASGASASGRPVLQAGVYTTNANQPAVTTGQVVNLQTDPAGNIRTAPQRPTATDILVGYATVTATTGTTTLLTVSAGRTWVGQLCASVDGNKAAAATGNGLVNATFLTTGTNAVPAAGTYFGVSTSIGANAATGTVGTQSSNQGCTPFTLVSPAGNTTTINYVTTCTNTTACNIHVSAIGVMQ